MTVTIKQIAEKTHLSVPTVSRILSLDGMLFRPETRDKVIRAAFELGYRPNTYRMALRTKRFNVVGLLYCSDPTRSWISVGTYATLLDELGKQDKHLICGHHCVDTPPTDADAALPRLLREWSADGLLLDAHAVSPEADAWIKRTQIPSIWLHTRRAHDCVFADFSAGAREGTERLIKLGHKKIMFLDLGHRGHRGHPETRAGYEAAMKAASLATQVVAPDPVAEADRAAFLEQWITANRTKNFPTAVLCAQLTSAMPLNLAAAQVGLAVPDDLSILAIHDNSGDEIGLKFTAMRLPDAEMAITALAMLEQKIAKPKKTLPAKALPLQYEAGQTVGRA